MAWPYTALTTYIAGSTPSIKASDLNDIQDAINDLYNVVPDFMPKAWASCVSGGSPTMSVSYGMSSITASGATAMRLRLVLSVAMTSGNYVPLVCTQENADQIYTTTIFSSTIFEVGLRTASTGAEINLQGTSHSFSALVFGKH